MTLDRSSVSTGRLAVSAGSMLAGRLLIAVFSWTGTVLIARQLGEESFGQFTLVFSLLGMLSVVTDLGLGRVAVAGLLRLPDDDGTYVGSYIVLRALLGLVGYALAVVVVVVAGYPSQVLMATIVGGASVLAATPSHAYDIAFQVKDRLPTLAFAGVFAQLAQLALTVAIVLQGGSVVWFAVPAVLNEVLILIWKVPLAHRLILVSYRIDTMIWKNLLREAIPLTLGAAFVTLYYRVDSLMLASLDGFRAVGQYGVGYKFVDLVHFVPTAVTVAVMAPLSSDWNADRTAFRHTLSHGFQILSTVACGSLVLFWLFATELATLFYGETYAAGGRAIRILITGETIGFFSALAITALLAASRHRRYPYITLAGLVLNVGANLVLIPRYSFEGAAVATLATEFLVGVLLWRLLSSLDIGRFVDRRFVLGLFAASVAAVAAGLGVDAVASWMLASVAAGIVFVATLDRAGTFGDGGLWQILRTMRP